MDGAELMPSPACEPVSASEIFAKRSARLGGFRDFARSFASDVAIFRARMASA